MNDLYSANMLYNISFKHIRKDWEVEMPKQKPTSFINEAILRKFCEMNGFSMFCLWTKLDLKHENTSITAIMAEKRHYAPII